MSNRSTSSACCSFSSCSHRRSKYMGTLEHGKWIYVWLAACLFRACPTSANQISETSWNNYCSWIIHLQHHGPTYVYYTHAESGTLHIVHDPTPPYCPTVLCMHNHSHCCMLHCTTLYLHVGRHSLSVVRRPPTPTAMHCSPQRDLQPCMKQQWV